jgi:4-hydroxy-3-polyprenylbenzoate decarboxylase
MMPIAAVEHETRVQSESGTQSRTLIVAVTGASGSIFAVELLRAVEADPRIERVELIISPSALRVLAEEYGGIGRSGLMERLLSSGKHAEIHRSSKVHLLEHEDIGASIASGSYLTSGMVILPCSMGTLAGIAHGMAGNLIERAADVCLKERRRLVLCVRETPLNLIHLRNMAAVTEAGATVFPVIPTFYNHPQSIEEIARNYVHRVLLHMGFPQAGAFAWGQLSDTE